MRKTRGKAHMLCRSLCRSPRWPPPLTQPRRFEPTRAHRLFHLHRRPPIPSTFRTSYGVGSTTVSPTALYNGQSQCAGWHLFEGSQGRTHGPSKVNPSNTKGNEGHRSRYSASILYTYTESKQRGAYEPESSATRMHSRTHVQSR